MTRIADLPDATGQMQSNMYVPINPHPNPYGIGSPPPGGIPHPSPEISFNQRPLSEDQYASMQSQIQRLPQRDIPIETQQYMHDEEVQPNYIPKPKLTADYIQEYQEATDKKIEKYEKEKWREHEVETWFDELYEPIIVGILYFLYQLPIVNRMVFQKLSFLQIYREDGNFNIWGLCLKGLLFGLSFMSLQRGLGFLSEI